jgi:hypothetical protein
MNYDEGAVYLYPGFLTSEGLGPYEDFIYTQPPGLLLYGNKDMVSLRGFILLTLAICCMVLFFFGKKYGVGWFSLVFLLSSPMVFEFSRVFMGDIPLMAFLTLFMAVVVLMPTMWGFFILGTVMWVALMFKLQAVIPLAVVVGYLVFSRKENGYAISMAVCVIGLIAAMAVYPNMIDEVVLNNMGAFGLSERLTNMVSSVVVFLYKGAFMLPFAAVGLYELICRRHERKFELLGVYLLSAVVTVFVYSGVNFRHLMFTIPVFAILAGMGLKRLGNKWLTVVVLFLAVLIPLGEVQESLLYDDDTRMLAGYVRELVPGGEMIYTEEPMVAYLAGRKMPPTAHMWNGLGRMRGLAADDVLGDFVEYRPQMVILVSEVTYDKKAGPRVYSMFGERAVDIFEYLDSNYRAKTMYKRNYQMMTIWYGLNDG